MTKAERAANDFKQEKWTRTPFFYIWHPEAAFIFLEVLENSQKNVTFPGITPSCSFFHWIFLKISKRNYSSKPWKNLMETKNMKQKISCDLWFSLTNMKVTLKQRHLTLEGLTYVNVSIIKLYDFFTFKYSL